MSMPIANSLWTSNLHPLYTQHSCIQTLKHSLRAGIVSLSAALSLKICHLGKYHNYVFSNLAPIYYLAALHTNGINGLEFRQGIPKYYKF